MRLSGIEIVVGEPSKKSTGRRHLSYRMPFTNDAGEECQRRHESLVHELALYDAPGIARIVAHVVRGLLIEDAGPDAPNRKPPTPAAPDGAASPGPTPI